MSDSLYNSEITGQVFSDAEFISFPTLSINGVDPSSVSEKSFENSNIGMVNDDGVIFNAMEAQVFLKIKDLVTQNKVLNEVLHNNNTRLKVHYEDCVKWKEQYLAREEDLMKQLIDEQNCYKVLNSKFESYKRTLSLNSISLTSMPEDIFETVDRNLKNLMEILPKLDDNDPENALTKDVVMEILESFKCFLTAALPDQNDCSKLESKLQKFQETLSIMNNNHVVFIAKVLSIVQSKLRPQSQPASIPTQQVSLEQYLDLNTKFDTILLENNQLKDNLKKKEDECNLFKEMCKDCEVLREENEKIVKRLTEKEKNLRNLEIQMNEMSVLIEPVNIKEIEAFKAKIQQLETTNKSLRDDLSETAESFTNSEERNELLEETIVKLQVENERLQNLKGKCVDGDVGEQKGAESYKELKKTNIHLQARVEELQQQIMHQENKFKAMNANLANHRSQQDQNLMEINKMYQLRTMQINDQTKQYEKLRMEKQVLVAQSKQAEDKNQEKLIELGRKNQRDVELLKNALSEKDLQMKAMSDDLESIPIFKTQLIEYENDFKAERLAHDKDRNEMRECKKKLDEVMLENNRLQEALQHSNSNAWADMQRRHSSMMSLSYDQEYGLNNSYSEQYSRQPNQYGGRGVNPPVSSASSSVEKNSSTIPLDGEPVRNCPKCQQPYPNLDALQIHVMECLDN